MSNSAFMPVMHHGIALFNQTGQLTQKNHHFDENLVDNRGALHLEDLLTDPQVKQMLNEAQEKGFAELDLTPEWWQGEKLSLSAVRCGDEISLTIINMTPIHRLAAMEQEFVANVSHELRTPLTSIRMAAESLQLGAMNSEQLRAKFLSNIQREADRLTRLVNELLVVANLHGKPVMHKNPFDFLELAQEVIGTLQPHADLNSVDLRLISPPELPVYIGDRDRLHQVLLNLVDNGVKFTPASGKVTLALAEANGAIQIKVIDSGIGIPPVDLPHIFDRFYRVDKSRSRVTGGVGLGLSIVKDIIEAHGGTIEVESEINKGTAFIITLPLK